MCWSCCLKFYTRDAFSCDLSMSQNAWLLHWFFISFQPSFNVCATLKKLFCGLIQLHIHVEIVELYFKSGIDCKLSHRNFWNLIFGEFWGILELVHRQNLLENSGMRSIFFGQKRIFCPARAWPTSEYNLFMIFGSLILRLRT
jgi:hypothetical protein